MDSQSFIVYKSSAGSGKTYTLVKEYLKIVLSDPSKIRHILAITFTNAAAAEMKERIIVALGELSALSGMPSEQWPRKSSQLVEVLVKETPLQSSEIIRHAQLALRLILHNYGDFSVSTIDSFAHKIIRSFAFDLRLPLNFDVELDQAQMLNQAIDLLVSRAGSQPQLTRLLVEYIESRTDEEQSHYIEYDMARLAKTLMDEKGTVQIDRLRQVTLEDFGLIHTRLNESIRRFEHEVQQLALKALQLIEANHIPLEMFYRGKPGIGSYFKQLANGWVAQKIEPNSYVQKTIEEDRWTATKANEAIKTAIESIKAQLTEYYLQIRQMSDQGLVIYKVHRLVKKHLFPMAVLCELEKVMDEIKSEHSLLHISDFNKKISEVVAVESAPFIYERIGERYHHYMIDEFQDTSGLQWQNLLPLIDNSLASGHTNLVVGDGKQAIYRWRNGDVEQFASLPLLPASIDVQARELWQQSLKRNYRPLTLDTNWRSLPQIIDFNNHFFEFCKNYLPDDLLNIYQEHKQKKHPEKEGGYVQITFVENLPDQDISYQDHTHLHILNTVRDLQHKEHPLSDITILCRSNKEASTIARYLLENKVNVISSESLLLEQSAKVNFILSIMRLINHMGDEVSLTEFLQFLIKSGKIADDLHSLLLLIKKTSSGHRTGGFELEALESCMQEHGILFSFGQCRHLGLYELGETIVRSFFDNGETDPFITFFLDVLHDYSNRQVSSVPDFLEWWAEHAGKYSVVIPEGVDAVQVMTIHKSKGLQFQVVIYPFADNDFSRPAKEGQWVELPDMAETRPLEIAWLSISSAMEGTPYEPVWQQEKGKTLLDLLNMVYVAFTRPVQKLFVLSRFPDSGKFSEKNLMGFLQKFLESQGLWQEQQLVYSFGQNLPAPSDPDAAVTKDHVPDLFQQYISAPWANKISVRSRQMEKHSRQTDATQRGSWIHQIMEKISTEEDIDPVLEKLYAAGQMGKNEKEKLQKKLYTIIQNPDIRPWYQKGLNAKNECGMYDSQGHFYRADRVVLQNDLAVIIDYKTGSPQPDHAGQIHTYASIIQQMGYARTQKLLVYLDHEKVELV